MHKHVRLFKWLLLGFTGLTFIFSVTLVPMMVSNIAWRRPEFQYMEYPSLFFIWATSIGFYYIVVLIFNICGNIEDGKAFTVSNAKLFDRIALIGWVELIAYFAGFVIVSILIKYIHPTVALVMFVVAALCLGLVGFCLVMKRLIRRVAEIKEENEYTV